MTIRTEWNVWPGPFVMNEVRRDAIKTFYTNRWSWLKNTWLPSQGYTPPANAHPTISLGNAYWSENGIQVDWQFADAEGDNCSVELYWTDMKWALMVPIPGAMNIPAANGKFNADIKIPADEFMDRGIYIHAVIRDDQSDLEGHDTSDLVMVVETCPQIWQYDLGLSHDFNQDCYVDTTDLAVLSDNWLSSGEILWDSSADFSTTQNPSGAWSYGWGAGLNDFTAYDKTYYHSGQRSTYWYYHTNGYTSGPFLWKNEIFWVYGIPPGKISQFPSNSLLSKLRWTSPLDGFVSVTGTIGKGSSAAGDLWIVKDGTEELYYREETNIDESVDLSLNNAVSVNIGTTIDFVHGAGDSFSLEYKSFDIKIGAGKWVCDGTGSFAMDDNQDCLINLEDFAAFTNQWMNCNDPANSSCSF
jgi:hypothetical protein